MRVALIRKCLWFCLLLLLAGSGLGLCLPAQAQGAYGHEWINFGQPYFRIPVSRNGIYRLDYHYLAAAGLTGADPRKLQVFRRGQEVAVLVSGQADGRLDKDDYLEFYGEKNDGKTDGELYQKKEYQVHEHYSLYTDTAAYFLTLHPSQAGKRIISRQQTSAGLSPESWHYQTRLVVYTNNYSRGIGYGDSQQPFGDQGEGFFSDFFGATSGGGSINNPASFTVDSILSVAPGGPPPAVELVLVGSYYAPPDVTVSVVSAGAERILGRNVRFAPFSHLRLSYQLQASDVSAAGTITFRIKVNTVVPPGGLADLVRLAYIKVRYPRNNVLTGGRDLYVSLSDSTASSSSYLLFEGGTPATVAYDVTDPRQVVRYESHAAGARQGFVFSPAGRQRRILVTANNKFTVPPPAARRVFRQFDPRKASYIVVSHRQLARAVPDYGNPVQAFAAYRASRAGGGHDTLVFYVDQLYDQFHYGDRSPLAIRRLMRYLLAQGNPRYLFLVGKGIEPDFGGGNFRRHPHTYPVFDLVPTGGAPASDAIFTADFQQNSFYPRVPTGRIPAMQAAEVASYLEKVKMHESLPQNADWRKNVIHLGGGTDGSQQQLFRNYLKAYENIVQGPQLGAKVETISRQTGQETVELVNISQQVNQGVSLITFFGHSSPRGADIDFGFVSSPVNNYNNLRKYPMILVNGCFSGNAFSAVPASQRSFGEDWILTSRKGAIAFLGHSAFGYSVPLHTYSRNLYQATFADPAFYGKPLGVVVQEAARRTAQSGSSQLTSTALEMVLQADPALVLVGPDKPDYAVAGNIILRPFPPARALTASADSFQVVIPLRNLGRATPDSFHVAVTRNGVEVKSKVKFAPVFNQDTLYFSFNDSRGQLAGENSLTVAIDPDNALTEIDELNNALQFTWHFPANSTRALLPAEYALVGTREVQLVGQAYNLLQANQKYYFEIDTTHTFSSPAWRAEEVEAGPFPSWKVTLPSQDSVVYYWRFRPKQALSPVDTIWGESSFRYIAGSAGGWSQSQYGQFTKARKDQLVLDEASRQWAFQPSMLRLQLRAAGGLVSASYPPYGILLNGQASFGGDCQFEKPNLLLTVISNKTLQPHRMPGAFGSLACGQEGLFYHFYDLEQGANREIMRRFLEAVPQGFYVALVSVNQVPFSSFTTAQKAAIRALGSQLIDSLQTGFPFALVGQKGGAATEQTYNPEDPLPPRQQSVDLSTSVETRGISGSVYSTIIGPAAQWGTLFHRVSKHKGGNDSYRLEVRAFDAEMKNPRIFFAHVSNPQQSLAGIDARQYPYLQLGLQVSDSLERTAPQLLEWRVSYQQLPEGVVRPDLVGVDHYANLGSRAAKGKIDLRFAFQNISETNFGDSLLARITVTGLPIAQELKLPALKKGEVTYIPFTLATAGLKGAYTLRLSVNPLLNNPQLQREQHYFNNILEVPFTYQASLPPILDVVFDGRHIMDGELVSPNPEISITLKDEDEYTFIQDPEHVELFLQYPGSADFRPVDLKSERVRFTPGGKGRDFRLVFTPEHLSDGSYTLRVQGRDIDNNKAGFEPYTIQFEVVNESAITHFYPYPNPFSTKTRFVFTLTGSIIPEKMKIQILTLTGKVVREIMQEELGPIRIGNNISAYAWDGTDEFGDKLANGVYLYRVVMQESGEFRRRQTAADKAFKKEFGKIYILR